VNVGLIVAAGRSTRFKEGAKQYALLAGRPMLAYSVEAFCRAGSVDSVVVVVRDEDREYCAQEVVASVESTKPITIVAGGNERQQSVAAGLKACPRGVDLVWVHDGARPLITPDQIDAMVDELNDFDGLTMAAPARDTIKHVEDGLIKRTIPRDQIWQAQTPQLFRFVTLDQAHKAAVQGGFTATDDSALVELLGGRVAVCGNDLDNIKVTTPSDLKLAERILLERTA